MGCRRQPRTRETDGSGVWSREQRLRGVLRGRQRLVTFVIQMGGDGPAKIKMGNAENIMGPRLKDIGPEFMLTVRSILSPPRRRNKLRKITRGPSSLLRSAPPLPLLLRSQFSPQGLRLRRREVSWSPTSGRAPRFTYPHPNLPPLSNNMVSRPAAQTPAACSTECLRREEGKGARKRRWRAQEAA
jgi:hypothetical protein